MTGDADPLAAIQDAVNFRGYDEIILSTLPARVSRWLNLDLPSKVQRLGLPVNGGTRPTCLTRSLTPPRANTPRLLDEASKRNAHSRGVVTGFRFARKRARR